MTKDGRKFIFHCTVFLNLFKKCIKNIQIINERKNDLADKSGLESNPCSAIGCLGSFTPPSLSFHLDKMGINTSVCEGVCSRGPGLGTSLHHPQAWPWSPRPGNAVGENLAQRPLALRSPWASP